MARRYGLKFRYSSYQEGNFYRLKVVGRRAVAPGERISKLVVDSRITTPVFSRLLINPFLVQTWAFYVPYRLLWDQWVDFIALDDSVTSVPTTTAAQSILEGSSGAPNIFGRRAIKLIANEFFGDEQYYNLGVSPGDTFYPDVTVDATVPDPRLLIWDQFRSHLKERSYTGQSFTASVAGATATIDLDGLSRALRDNRARRRQKFTGDKYVDTMRLMGVDLDWRVQMAPEFLGSSQQVVWPRECGSSQADATAGVPAGLQYRGSSLDVQQQFVLRRPVAFAEHGLLMAFVGVRPLLIRNTPTLDSWLVQPTDFYRPDTQSGPSEGAPGGANSFGERNAKYLRGSMTSGGAANGYYIQDSGNFQDIYPLVTAPLFPDQASYAAFSAFTEMAVAGLTPIPSGNA